MTRIHKQCMYRLETSHNLHPFITMFNSSDVKSPPLETPWTPVCYTGIIINELSQSHSYQYNIISDKR